MFDSIIIGAGPSGLSAAIYLKNANKNILVIEKSTPGGKILKAKKINNYLGIENLSPDEIAYNMYKQVIDLDVKISSEKVLKIEKLEDKIKVITDKNEYFTKTILLSCGRIEKGLDININDDILGISYCATCDGSLYKNKVVTVIGNNLESKQDTIYLSSIAKSINYINYSKDDITFPQDNIKVFNNKKIININAVDNKITNIVLDDNNVLETDGLFILNGYTPNSEFINNLDLKLDNGYIVVDKNMKTNIDGIYASGDIIKKDLYQIVTAASEGAVAAISIIKDLK